MRKRRKEGKKEEEEGRNMEEKKEEEGTVGRRRKGEEEEEEDGRVGRDLLWTRRRRRAEAGRGACLESGEGVPYRTPSFADSWHGCACACLYYCLSTHACWKSVEMRGPQKRKKKKEGRNPMLCQQHPCSSLLFPACLYIFPNICHVPGKPACQRSVCAAHSGMPAPTLLVCLPCAFCHASHHVECQHAMCCGVLLPNLPYETNTYKVPLLRLLCPISWKSATPPSSPYSPAMFILGGRQEPHPRQLCCSCTHAYAILYLWGGLAFVLPGRKRR